MIAYRILAIAASTGRVGCVFIVGGRLVDWWTSDKASRSPNDAAELAKKWIAHYRPDAVVTEKTSSAEKKGQAAKAVTEAIANVAADHVDVLDISVVHTQEFKDKYEEASVLAEQYPDLKPWLPKKRRFFDREPRNIVIFEALALALIVIKRPTESIAASMG